MAEVDLLRYTIFCILSILDSQFKPSFPLQIVFKYIYIEDRQISIPSMPLTSFNMWEGAYLIGVPKQLEPTVTKW
jgi:hypothetical protein